ncbi:hypothetical protein [Massilia sp. BSC265]|uniref:hypothetical protein n=1 Tax=Massilia sp. BSC265 TaxID=1549812 RepID=UPI0004E97F3D|nr:hypothetical protein [Massilia sp. BSC265]KFI07737.1 hypothetical protein JN27_09265 [Massilia sp. BSC265]
MLGGTALEANRQALAPCQLPREDVVGRPLWEGRWWRGAAAMVDTVRGGVAQAASGEVFRCDLAYLAADSLATLRAAAAAAKTAA